MMGYGILPRHRNRSKVFFLILKGWGFCHHSCLDNSPYVSALKMVKLATLPDHFCKVINISLFILSVFSYFMTYPLSFRRLVFIRKTVLVISWLSTSGKNCVELLSTPSTLHSSTTLRANLNNNREIIISMLFPCSGDVQATVY